MTKINLDKKIRNLEKDILEIKRYLGFSERDLDFENWQKIKKISKNIRRDLFKEKYPQLYAKISKKRK